MRIAILGAGFQGACIALEFARRGLPVELYDRRAVPISAAGFVNEGKIHLGFVYANDPTLRTARQLIRGALHFRACLERWTETGDPAQWMSEPFDYLVHRDSAMPAASLEDYFTQLEGVYRELAGQTGLSYLGLGDQPLFESFEPGQLHVRYDSRKVAAAFRTLERSVDPERVASMLRAAITREPLIAHHPGCLVEHVSRATGSALEIGFRREGRFEQRTFDCVVNCLWDGRLAIDATLRLRAPRPWIYRYKFRVSVAAGAAAATIPTATLVHGPFGDLVRYGSGRVYVSWYPVCMKGTSLGLAPPDWDRRFGDGDRRAIAARTLTALAEVAPAVADLEQMPAEVRGGVIIAWGNTDIDDRTSGLHERHAIGVTSMGGYHSVDPGKYTMAPLFAVELCDRVLGREPQA